MSHVPIEYWIPGSVLLTLATIGVTSLLPVPAILESVATASIIFWLVLWAYSPLPQGPHAAGHKRRKRVWGFSVAHQGENKSQRKLNDYQDE